MPSLFTPLHRSIYLALILAFFFIGCTYQVSPTPVAPPVQSPISPSKPTQTTDPHFISEEKAIERAIDVNNTGHLSQQETPRVLSAEILTYQEAQKAIKGEGEEVILNHPLERLVWLVRLGGKWFISGGPAATEKVPAGKETLTSQSPSLFTTCYAILDANTGELFVNGCRALRLTAQPSESSTSSDIENPWYPLWEFRGQKSSGLVFNLSDQGTIGEGFFISGAAITPPRYGLYADQLYSFRCS